MRDLLSDMLGLPATWFCAETDFDSEMQTVMVTLDFAVGSEFTCSACGIEGCKAYDTTLRHWRHTDCFQYRCFLRAHSPRVNCPACGIRQAVIPWARLRSRVTYDFEKYLLVLADELSYLSVARIVGEHDTRVRYVVRRAGGHVDGHP